MDRVIGKKVWIIGIALALAAVARAQTSRGTVTGTVVDASGAPIAGLHVDLVHVDKGVHQSTDSNDTGVYRFDAVDPGVYNLTVARPGFKTYLATGIMVEANRATTIDPKLELGATETGIQVNGESSDILIKDSPLRGGNFQPRDALNLPLLSLNPLSLTRILPGVTEASGSTVWGGGYSNGGAGVAAVNANGAGFSINGQRPRGNNYLLDGTENNEVWLSGEGQVFSIGDGIQEVSVQTGNFGVEFGRAGGGIFNVITKSGSNNLHGTLLWRYQSGGFDSVRNIDRLAGIGQPALRENTFGFTAGGPIRRNMTFFFAAFQQENNRSGDLTVQVPTADAVPTLLSLFPNNPRLTIYLNALGNLRGTAQPFTVLLGQLNPQSPDRGSVQFATAAYGLPAVNDGPQWLGRVDHYQSPKHRLSWRYAYDSRHIVPVAASFPGFVQEDAIHHDNLLFSDTYIFGPTFTNEFRFSYGRLDGAFNSTWPNSNPLAETLPQIQIANVSAPGVASGNASSYVGDNFLFEETQTKLTGSHAFRYGVEFLKQRITQNQDGNTLGTINFTDSLASGYSAFANFLDNFSGPSASLTKVFGAAAFHPDQFHQTYFLEDNWKATKTLALTFGLRYENFGQFANSLPYPAFSGFDPSQFLVRHEVHADDKDFGPSLGFAWAPALGSGWLGRFLGEGNTVWRGGFQISYDSLPTQLISLGPATSTPNAKAIMTTAANSGRGSSDWFSQLPTASTVLALTDSQMVIDGNLRNPYTERWSFGLQRKLPGNTLLDVSYVGSESHRLTTRADWNPRLPAGPRLYPNYGQVIAKTSQGNSSYHALQARLDRRFSHGFQISAAYTWSKMIDSASDGIGSINVQQPNGNNLTSVPAMYGGLALDRSVSDFDRPQRLTIAYVWELPGPGSRWPKYIFGGWQLAGITIFQSGTPFSVANGADRNNYADKEDRADIGDPNAAWNARAILFPACATGYENSATSSCVSPGSVHWLQGIGFPNASTVGRNTLRTGGTNNFDLNLTKSIPFGETRRLELRCEALNALNHPQFVNVPDRNVATSLPGRFLNRDYTDSGIRSVWAQVKLVF